jgi:hypothetical protein
MQEQQQYGDTILRPHGFGEFDVAEMPAYVQSYSKRGNAFDSDTTPVYQQTRFGNKRNVGGMDAYVSALGDETYFEGLKQKNGNPGVYELLRWGPGYDWRGNFGVASLSEMKNFVMSTRGGELRNGGPKRSDIVDRKNFWFDTIRPGLDVGRFAQTNENYDGVYEWKRQTPVVQRDSDFLVLREMIEHNPWHIVSHAAVAAKEEYDAEFGALKDSGFAAYDDNL